MNNQVIIIAGPTASGKSQMAIDIALAAGGEVVNADSMQVYRNTPLISACPSAEDKQKVPHHLYEIWDASKNGSVVDWLELAVAKIREIWQRGGIPVVAGGTGLYLDNLINGTTPIPETSAEVKQKVKLMLAEDGVQKLHALLTEHDSETASRLSPNDTTRVRRALEVWFGTGKALSEWHRLPMVKKLPEAVFFVVKIIPDPAELDERCYRRFDMMLEQGAAEEIRRLAALDLDPKLPAMRALGVPELLDYVRGKCTLEEAAANGKLIPDNMPNGSEPGFKNKLKADLELNQCYTGQKNVLENIIKGVKK